MTIEIKKNTQNTTVSVVGRLDTITAPVLEKTLGENISDTKNLILDLRGLNTSPAQVSEFFSARRKRCRRSEL